MRTWFNKFSASCFMAFMGLTLIFAVSFFTPSSAQVTPPPSDTKTTNTNDELKGVNRQIEQSAKRETKISAELSTLEREASEISRRLISLASKTQSREAKISTSELRIAKLNTSEQNLIANLNVKRDTLGELLVGLQRLQANPPPPLAAHPRDALAAVRSATLFGSIIPAIKAQTTVIRLELVKLTNVRQKLKIAQTDLQKDTKTLDSVRAELRAALAHKNNFVKKTQSQLLQERKRTKQLSLKARDLKDLLNRIKKQNVIAEKQRIKVEKQRVEAEKQRIIAKRQATQAEKRAAARALAIKKARLLRPKIAFTKAIGKVRYPVHGKVLRQFGQKSGLGGKSQGILMATRKLAQVTAPVDGVVEFAGKFRSYGQLLILNVGQGYHMLLGGLERIDVQTGQQVRAGEPVGLMGKTAARKTLITASLDVNKPVLYIEFRKNGGPVDPSRWWHKNLKKVRN